MKKYNKLIINGLKLGAFIIMLGLFIYFGTKDYEGNMTDNVRFANEYKDITKNNIFVYAKNHDVLNIITKGSGVLFLGFTENIWSHYYADYLNEVAIENEIDKIYYYDFKKDRNLNNDTYERIVKALKNYLVVSDTEVQKLSAPTVIVVKNGEVIYFNDDIQEIKGIVAPDDYFTDYKKNYLKAEFSNALKLYKGELE